MNDPAGHRSPADMPSAATHCRCPGCGDLDRFAALAACPAFPIPVTARTAQCGRPVGVRALPRGGMAPADRDGKLLPATTLAGPVGARSAMPLFQSDPAARGRVGELSPAGRAEGSPFPRHASRHLRHVGNELVAQPEGVGLTRLLLLRRALSEGRCRHQTHRADDAENSSDPDSGEQRDQSSLGAFHLWTC